MGGGFSRDNDIITWVVYKPAVWGNPPAGGAAADGRKGVIKHQPPVSQGLHVRGINHRVVIDARLKTSIVTYTGSVKKDNNKKRIVYKQNLITQGLRQKILLCTKSRIAVSLLQFRPLQCPISISMRPSSNKKSFPVHRPGGLKRAYWNFFFHLFKQFFFLLPPPPPPPVHSSLTKLKLGKKKIRTSRLAVVFPTRPTGNDFLLKGGLITVKKKHIPSK